MSRPDIIPAYRLRGSSSFSSSDMVSRNAFVRSSPRLSAVCAMVHREHARTDRVPLGLVGVEQALRRRAADHLRQLPSQVHGVLDADVEPLPARRRVHVRRVAGQEHASLLGRSPPAGSCR